MKFDPEVIRDKSPRVTDREALADALSNIGTMSPRLRKLYDDAAAQLRADAKAQQPLPAVEGDILPAVGSKVLIHLASQDAWVEHTVAGYYVWPNHGLAPRVFRVFVRVRDADGYLNARSLEDIRYSESACLLSICPPYEPCPIPGTLSKTDRSSTG